MCGVRGQIPDLAVAVVAHNSDDGGSEDASDGVCSVRCSFWR